MGGFKLAEKALVRATQNYFSESATYKRDTTTKQIKAVFEQQWIESQGVSTYALTARVAESELGVFSPPQSNDILIRGSTTYKVLVAQQDNAGAWTLVLQG